MSMKYYRFCVEPEDKETPHWLCCIHSALANRLILYIDISQLIQNPCEKQLLK